LGKEKVKAGGREQRMNFGGGGAGTKINRRQTYKVERKKEGGVWKKRRTNVGPSTGKKGLASHYDQTKSQYPEKRR